MGEWVHVASGAAKLPGQIPDRPMNQADLYRMSDRNEHGTFITKPRRVGILLFPAAFGRTRPRGTQLGALPSSGSPLHYHGRYCRRSTVGEVFLNLWFRVHVEKRHTKSEVDALLSNLSPPFLSLDKNSNSRQHAI